MTNSRGYASGSRRLSQLTGLVSEGKGRIKRNERLVERILTLVRR